MSPPHLHPVARPRLGRFALLVSAVAAIAAPAAPGALSDRPSPAPRAFVPPGLIADAKAHPQATVHVIVQGAGGRNSSQLAAAVDDEAATPAGKRAVHRKFRTISGVAAELTGKQLLKLAARKDVLAITRDDRVVVSDTTLPTVGGVARAGRRLIAQTSSWLDGATYSYTYQWQRCGATEIDCADIAGATGATYDVAAGDIGSRLRFAATAVAADGTISAATSDPTTVVAPEGQSGYWNRQHWPYVAQLPRAWDRLAAGTLPGPVPAIAIVDSGVDGSAPGLERLVTQVSLTGLAPNGERDGRGHGTFVAGIAGGRAEGYAGAAPEASLISIDVMDDNARARTSDVIAAADWIRAHKDEYGIRVANFSLVGSMPTTFEYDPLDKAVERLWLSGVVVVAAAGNYAVDGTRSGVHFAPANDPFVITVGAADTGGTIATGDDTAAPWSAYGSTPDGFLKPELGAPGRYMIAAVPSDSTLTVTRPDRIVSPGYMQLSGTSFAAPVVAGAAANLLALHPEWTPGQVKGALMVSAAPVPAAPYSLGVGELDAAAAVRVVDPPDADRALARFLVPDPAGGSTPVFDAAAWRAAAAADPAWSAEMWGSEMWGSALWSAEMWGSGYWTAEMWGSEMWGSEMWGSEMWGSEMWGSEMWGSNGDPGPIGSAEPTYSMDADDWLAASPPPPPATP